MLKYQSFKEYIQVNYADEFNESLAAYLLEKGEDGYDWDSCCISSCNVTSIKFTKNQINHVEFKINLWASYTLSSTKTGEIEQRNGYFSTKMRGDFNNGFHHNEDNNIQEANGPECEERITKGLVPIIPFAQMDEKATEFLKKNYPEALETPMKLPVEKLFERMGIESYFAPLPDNVFGETYFGDDKALVYGSSLDYFGETNPIEKDVKHGTVLINLNKHMDYPDGVYRNTMVHEAVHYYFHRNYFELRLCLDPTDTHVTCYKSESEMTDVDISWMEWHAKCLAPRILMPKQMALLKFHEIEEEVNAAEKGKETDDFEIRKKILSKFANFFGVTKQSAKTRLNALGINGYDGLGVYVDNDKIQPYTYKPSFLKKYETFTIGVMDFFNLLTTNPILKEAVRSEKLIYTNRMLVVNNKKYIKPKCYKMTDYALHHADECCVVFKEEHFNSTDKETAVKMMFLCSDSTQKQKRMSVDPESSIALIQLADDNMAHFKTHQKNIPDSFHETLQYHFNKCKDKGTFRSVEDWSFDCDISDKTLYRYLNGEREPENRTMILKMGLSLKLSYPYMVDLFEKANLSIMNWSSGENLIISMALLSFQRLGLSETYKRLKKIGKEEILGLSDRYISDFCE